MTKLVAEHFPAARDAVILEVGCGYGALLHVARAAGYTNLSGIDASPEQVAAAAKLGIAGVTEGDLLTTLAALPADSHDAIVAFDVIEHLTKDELIDFTDQVLRVLRPGGRWIVHVPNAASPFFGAVRYGDLTHELAFTSESLAQLVLASGFREVRSYEDRPIPHGLKSWGRAVLWRLLRRLLGFYLMVEVGAANQPILTQNLLAVAVK